MGNVGIALGSGKAFAAPAWLVMAVAVLAYIGLKSLIKKK